MGQPVPHRWITGLPALAQKQIERNFLALQTQIVGAVTIYDAIIDAANPSNASAHRYKNMSDLVTSESANIVATRMFCVGVVNNGSNSVITETGSITLGGPMMVQCIGQGGERDLLFDYGTRQVWDFAGFSITGASGIPMLTVDGMWIQASSGAGAPFANLALTLHNCVVAGTPGPNFTAAARTITSICTGSFPSAYLYAYDSYFLDLSGLGGTANYIVNCVFGIQNTTIASAAFTIGQETWLIGCAMKQFGSSTFSWTISGSTMVYVDMAMTIQNIGGGTGGSSNASLTVSNTGPTFLNMHGSAQFQPTFNLTVNAGAGDITVIGNAWGSILVSGNTNGNERSFDVVTNSVSFDAIDITGPAQVKAHIRASSGTHAVAKLRGKGIRADLYIKGNGSGGFLQLIGCTDSIITADLVPPGSSGWQAYAIDASSARCVLVLNDQSSNFSVASVNSGTNCLVVDELGVAPTGAAGGSLAGTYPNPSIASSVSLPGSPTTTTQLPADNSTKVATTAYADAGDALKANIASPTFTGDPKAPTPSPGDNDTSIATTAFVTAAISAAPVGAYDDALAWMGVYD